MANGKIVTFYSWKGGVGRSMALANIGANLSQRGRSVLLIDWDLEAPGLDKYFCSDEALSAGVAISDPIENSGLIGILSAAAVGSEGDQRPDWRARLRRISLPRLSSVAHGADVPSPNILDLLPAGDIAPTYASILGSFSWAQFYGDASGAMFLENLRHQWSEAYDFILIDSRTGLTDSGGVCTIQMPDWLVFVFTSNMQSLDGGLRVLDGIQEARRNFAFDRMPANILPLLSRWDGENEVDLGSKWLECAAERTKSLFEPWLPATLDARLFYEKVRIPHLARFSFGEPLPVITHRSTDESLPGAAFIRVAQILDSNFRGVGEILDPSYRPPLTKDRDFSFSALVLSDDISLAREIRLLEKQLGADNPEFARELIKLGNLLRRRSQHQSAEAILRRAFSITRSIYGDNDVRVAPTLNSLGGMLSEMGRINEAKSLLKQAVSLYHNAHVITEASLEASNNLAKLLIDIGEDSDAEDMLRETVGLCEDYGFRGEVFVDALLNLANMLRDAGKFLEAAPIYHRLLGITENAYGPDHPNVAAVLDNLADLMCRTDGIHSAEALYRRALAIDEASLGANSPRVAERLNGLGKLLRELNRCAEAEEAFGRALSVNEMNFGTSHPSVSRTLNNLAGLFAEMNREEQVEDLYRRALEIDENFYGPTHIDVAAALNNLASWLVKCERYEEAEILYKRSLAIVECRYGLDHFNTATTINNLASLLTKVHRLEEAEELFRRALKIDENAVGPSHSRIAVRLANLGVLLMTMERFDEAEEMLRGSLRISLEYYGPHHSAPANTLYHLANLLQKTGRLDEARDTYLRTYDTLNVIYGPQHPNVVRVASQLAALVM